MTSSLEKRYPPIKLTNGTDAIVPSTLRDSNTNTNIKDSTSGQTMNVSVAGADYGNGDYEVKIGALNWGSNKTSAGASITTPAVGGLFKIFETQTSATTSEDTLRLGLTGNNHTTLTGANSYNYVHNTQSQGILTLHTAMSNSNFLFQNGSISSDNTSAEYYGAFNGNYAFTIDFYFSTLQSGPDRAMFSVGGSQADGQSFTIYMHNGTIKISAGGASYSVDFSDSFSNLNNGKIYHLRCRYLGTTISLTATNNVQLKIIEAGQNIDAASYITKSFLPNDTVLSISTADTDQLIYFGRHANKSSSIYNFIGKLHYNLSIGHYLDYAIDGGYEAATNNQAVDNYYMTNFIKDSDGSKTHIASGTNGIPGQWISLKIPAVAAVTLYAHEDDPEETIELSAVDSSPNGIIPTKFYIGGITEPFPKTITVLGSTDGTHYTTIVDNAHKQLKDGTFEMLVKTLNNTYNEFVFIFTQTTLPGNYLEITELGVYGYEPSNTTFIDSTGIGNSTLKPMYYNDFTSHVFDGNMFSYVNITPDEDISGSTPFTIDINYSTDTVNNYLGPIFSMGRDNVVAGNYTIEQNPLSSPTNHYTWKLNNTHYISYANMLPSTATTSTSNVNSNFNTPHDNSINLLPDINTRHQLVVSSDGSYNVNFMLDGKIVKTELRQTSINPTKPNNLNNGKDSMFNISIGNRTPKFSFNTPYNGSNEFYFDGTTSNVINLNDSGNITRNGTILFANAGFAWMAGNAARTVTFEMKTTAVNVGDVILIGTGDNNNGGRFNVVIDQYGKLLINAHHNDTSPATHDDIRDGQWHFVSISWDGSNIQIYLDKILVLTHSLTTLNTPVNGGVAYLGANVNGDDNLYTGYLRNVHFYNGNMHTDNKFKGKIHRVAVYKDLFIDDPQKIKILDISGGVNVSKVQNNSDLKIHSTGALQIPNHTIDPEIITPEQSKGSIYYNTMFNCYKGYDGTSWKVIKGGITNESGTVYVNSDANMSLFTSHIGQNAVLDISMENIEFKSDSNGNRLLIDIIGSENLKGAKNIQGTPLSIVLKFNFDGSSRAIDVSQEIIKRFFDIENVAEDDGFFGTHGTTSDWGRGYLYSSTTDNNNTINSLATGGNNATVAANKYYIAIISYNGDKTITYTIYNETDDVTPVSISETQDYYQNLTLNDGFYFGGDSNNWFEGTIYYMQIHHHYFLTYAAFTQHVDGYIVLSSINEDITMTNYGNVGIGSTNPQTTLDVNGSLGVSTDIEFYDPMFTSARGSVRYNNQVAVTDYGFILNENHVPDYSFILNGNLASVTDVYGSGASLELKGGATTSYHGVQLDGVDDYINIPKSILSFTGNFTLSLWIEAKNATNLTRIFSGGHDYSPSFNLSVASNSMSIGIFNKNTDTYGENNFSTALYAVDGIIHNYVISRKSGTMRLFIDGIKLLEYSNNYSFVNEDYQIGYAIPQDQGIYAKFDVYRFDIWNNKGFDSVNDAKIIFDGGYNINIQFLPLSAYQSISLEHENATIGDGDYNNKLTISDGVTLSMNNGTSLDFNKTNTRIKNGRGNAELNIGGSVAIGSTYDGLQVNTNTLYVEGAVGIGTTSILENDNMVIYDKTLAKDAVNISKAGSIIMDNSGGFNNEKMLYFPPCKIRPSSFKTLAHENLTNANGTSQTLAPNTEQIYVYFDVSQNNLSYGRGRYYLSMASVETNNLGYKHLFSGIPSSGDTQHLVSKENTIYPNPSYIASTNAPNYQDLNIYGWWFSLQMPNPITLDHFTVNLEKGTNPVIRRIKRVFVIATNDSVDYYKLGYFGGAGVHGSSVISSDANLAQFSYYAEQGKNMQSSPFLKYIFIVTQTNGDVNNVALSSFRIYGSQGKLKIHQSLNASRAYIGNKKPYFSYGVNNPITFNNTDVDLTANGFKCIKGKAPRTFEFEINSIFNLSEGTTSNGNTTQFSNFIATGNRYNNKQTFNIRQAKDKLGIVRYGGLVHVNWDLSEDEVFDGHWHHYRITYDNDYFTCYVDHIKRPAYIGVHSNDNTESTDGYTIKDKSGEMNTQGDTNRIGRSNDNSYPSPFYGQMRNIHFYDHVSEGSITFDVASSSQTSKMIMDNANAPNYLNTQGPNRIEIDNTSGIGVQMHLTSRDAIAGMGVGSINYISEGDHHVFETENSFMDINKQRLYLPGPVNYNDLSLNNNYKYSEDFINNETGLNVNGSIYVDGPWTNPPTSTDLSNRVFGAVDATTGYAKNNLIDGKISNTYTCFDGTQSLYNHDVSGGYKDYAIVNLEETTLTNKNYTTFMHLDGEATYLWNGGTDNFVELNQTYTIQNQYLNATEVIPTEAYMGGTHLNSNTGGTGYMVTHITKVKINDYIFGILDPDPNYSDRWKMVRIEFAIENNNVIINSISTKERYNVTAPVTDALNIQYWIVQNVTNTNATSFTSGDLGIFDLDFQIKNYTSEPYFTHGIDQELYFDGTESSVVDLTLEGLTCVKGSNPRTIEFDFKTTSTSDVGLISTGYGQTTTTEIIGASFNIKLISGALFFMGFNKDYTSPNATGLNDDDWHTVKVTYSKPYLSFFVDNVLTDRVASSVSYDGTLINTQDDNNVLGRSNDIVPYSHASYYTGYLRNVRFYDYAQNDNDYNIIYSYVPNFEENDSYATYSYYKTHGKDCSQYSLFNSDLSLGVGKAPSGTSAVTFEPWTNFIKQNVLMLGEPDSSVNSQPDFISLPKAEADHLKAQNGFSIMFYAEIVQGNDNNDDTQLISINYNSRPSIVVAYLSGKFRIDSFNKVSDNNLVESSTMSFPSGINQFTLTVTSSAQKLYINGTLIVNNVYTITDGIIGFPTGNDTNLWTIGQSVPYGFSNANESILPMKIYNVATFGKELSINEINTIKCFSDNNALSPLINTNKCAYGNTTIDVNRTITNAIVERDVQYIYNHNIKKISICPEHDATPSMLRATRIVTNSKPANGSVDVNHLELQGDGILGGSSIHLNAAQKVIIDGSLNISGNVYYDVSGGIKTIIPDYLQHNSDINAPGFQIFANNEDSGLKIDASGSDAQNPLIMGTTGSAANRNIAFSKNAGLHIQPDGQAGVNNENQRGTIDTHRGLDVSGTVFGIYPVGSIMMYPYQVVNNISNNLPPGWKLCDGSTLSRTNYSELYAIIGNTYGNGNGSSTFNLPNFNTHYYAFGTNTSTTGSYSTTFGNNSMTPGQLAIHNHNVTTTTFGDLSFHNADINTQNKITYVTSADGAMANNHKLPIFKDDRRSDNNNARSRNIDWSGNGSRITKFSHIYNIITPAGTSVANQNTHSNLMNVSETITNNNTLHQPFHIYKDNVLDISNQDVTVTHSLTSNNTGIGAPWLPKSTQMKSIIYTGVL
jgi:microcystin-dependent protein